MTTRKPESQPYEISARFYRALQEGAIRLEADAEKDEAAAATLDHPDHQRRHKCLVRAQRERARLLHRFLADARVRAK
jgi:fructose-bisphosphate aldolase class 1